MSHVVRLLVCLAFPMAVGALSGLVTAGSVRDWYPTLAKPWFTPPAWVFGPAWTTLYLLMGVALYLVWRAGWERADVRTAVLLFAVQLILNGLWSLLFFGLRSPALALVEIGLLWTLIAATLAAFWRVTALAGVLLVPYLAWVTFAAALNGAIWLLNR